MRYPTVSPTTITATAIPLRRPCRLAARTGRPASLAGPDRRATRCAHRVQKRLSQHRPHGNWHRRSARGDRDWGTTRAHSPMGPGPARICRLCHGFIDVGRVHAELLRAPSGSDGLLGAADPAAEQVNHRDCDPWNNAADNLEYVTPGANVRHAIARGRRQPWTAERRRTHAERTRENLRRANSVPWTAERRRAAAERTRRSWMLRRHVRASRPAVITG